MKNVFSPIRFLVSGGLALLSAVSAWSQNAPTVTTWATLPPNPLYTGTNFTAQATGADADGNLAYIFVDSSVNGGAWTPFAYNGASAPNGNGSSSTSDGNILTAGAVGTTYQFRAMAGDSSGSDSGWQYTAVYTVANRAPTVSWPTLPPAPIYTSQYFTVRATGSDADGNLTHINVEFSTNGGAWTPFAYHGAGDNGGNGFATTTNNNGVTAGAVGTTYQFRALAIDGVTNSGWQYTAVYTVANRAPTVSWPNLPSNPLSAGAYVTARATGSDADGNLASIIADYSLNGGTWTPLAYHVAGDNGGNGFSTSTNYNGVSVGGAGSTVQFRAQATDTATASSGWQYTAVYAVPNKSDQTGVAGSLDTGSVNFPATATVTATGGQSSGAYEFRQSGGTGAVNFSGSGATRTLTPTTAGTVPVEVRKLGDASYNDSAWVAAGTLTISKGTQAALTAIATPSAQNYPSTVALSTSGGTGTGAVSYAVVSGPGTISGSTLTPTGVGMVRLTATKAADANYNAITSGNLDVAFGQGTQSGVAGTLGSTSIFLSGTTTVTASGGQGSGAYEFRQNGGTGNVGFSGAGAGRTITPTTVGTAVIEVRRLGDANYGDSAWVGAGTLTVSPTPPATGGTITTSGDYTIHTFTSSGTFVVNSSLTAEVLLVGGGGGGSSGGGGAGGVKLLPSVPLSAGSYTVTVGAGGAGNGGFTGPASAGGSSQLGSYFVLGGGGGGSALTIDCGTGGSGGGAGRYWNASAAPGAAGTPGEGYAGGASPGNSTSLAPAGGGGGAGGAGLDGIAATNTSGAGGPGVAIAISGSSVYYGGGGGGGSTNAVTAGAGGIGGGGAGSSVNGVPGTAGTNGLGGGGGGSFDSTANGGAGGSGVVIVRYLTVQKQNQGTVTVSPATPGAINVGNAITFTAAGGDGTGGYSWAGTAGASGTGSSKTVTFSAAGVYTVTVKRLGDSQYHDSNTATASVTVYAVPSTSTLWQPTLPGGGGTPSSQSADGIWSYRYDTLSLDALSHPAAATWSETASEPYLVALATHTSLMPSAWWSSAHQAWENPLNGSEPVTMVLGADSNQRFTMMKPKAPTATSSGTYQLNADGYNPIVAFKAPLSGTRQYSVKADIAKAPGANAQAFGDGVLVEVYRVERSNANRVTRLWSTLMARPATAKINLLTDLVFGDEIFFRVSSPTTDGSNDLVHLVPTVKLALVKTYDATSNSELAVSSGPSDSKTAAINGVLGAAASFLALNTDYDRAIVQLSAGDYYLGSPPGSSYLQLSGANNVTLRGSSTAVTRLIGTDNHPGYINVTGGANVILENLVFDLTDAALPFIQGGITDVISQTDGTRLIKVLLDWVPGSEAEFATATTTGNLYLLAFQQADPDLVVIERLANGTPKPLTLVSSVIATNGLGQKILQAVISGDSQTLAVGDKLVLNRWVGSSSTVAEGAIIFNGTTDGELRGVTVRAGTNLTIMCRSTNGMHFDRYRIERANSVTNAKPRWVSTLKDGVHSQGARRGATLENSFLSGMIDDGFNHYASIGAVTGVSGSVLTVNQTVETDDVLLLYASAFGGACSYVKVSSPGANNLQPTVVDAFGGSVTIPAGCDKFVNLSRSGEGFIIRNNNFSRNRARGALLQTGPGLVTENLFDRVCGLGIWYATEIFNSGSFQEGPFPHEITTRFNYFYRAGYAHYSADTAVQFYANSIENHLTSDGITPTGNYTGQVPRLMYDGTLGWVRNNVFQGSGDTSRYSYPVPGDTSWFREALSSSKNTLLNY